MLSSCGAHSAWLPGSSSPNVNPSQLSPPPWAREQSLPCHQCSQVLAKRKVLTLAPPSTLVKVDGGLIEVGLVLERVQRRAVDDDRILRCQLAQPAHRPGVVGGDLVIEADHRVPVVAVFDDREVERRPGGEARVRFGLSTWRSRLTKKWALFLTIGRPARSPTRASRPRPSAGRPGWRRSPFRSRLLDHVAEHHARELVGAALGHGVDDRAAGAAVSASYMLVMTSKSWIASSGVRTWAPELVPGRRRRCSRRRPRRCCSASIARWRRWCRCPSGWTARTGRPAAGRRWRSSCGSSPAVRPARRCRCCRRRRWRSGR